MTTRTPMRWDAGGAETFGLQSVMPLGSSGPAAPSIQRLLPPLPPLHAEPPMPSPQMWTTQDDHIIIFLFSQYNPGCDLEQVGKVMGRCVSSTTNCITKLSLPILNASVQNVLQALLCIPFREETGDLPARTVRHGCPCKL